MGRRKKRRAPEVSTWVEEEKLTRNKGTGHAYFYLPDETGKKKRYSMGRYWLDEERKIIHPRTLQRAARFIRQYKVTGGPPVQDDEPLTVDQLVQRFMKAAREDLYVDEEGNFSTEIVNYEVATDFLVKLYGSEPVDRFGPVALKGLLDAMVREKRPTTKEDETPKARWSRYTINGHLGRIRRVFKWGVANELIPASLYHALKTVEGVKKGRKPKRVRPIEDKDIAVDRGPQEVRGGRGGRRARSSRMSRAASRASMRSCSSPTVPAKASLIARTVASYSNET